MIFPELIFWGLFSGFMGGLLGVGGGLIFVLVIPAAAEKLGIYPESIVAVTIANSLACTFFTTFAAGIKRFIKEPAVRNAASLIGFSSTIISVLVLSLIVNPGLLSPMFFNIFFLLIVSYLIVRLFLKWKSQTGQKDAGIRKNNFLLLLTGLFSGIVSPLSGLGGGVVVVPVLHGILHYPIRMAQSVSFGVIAISTLASSIFNFFDPVSFPSGVPHIGLIVGPLILHIAPAAILGAIAGTWFSSKLSSRWSGGILLGFLLLILLRKIITIL